MGGIRLVVGVGGGDDGQMEKGIGKVCLGRRNPDCGCGYVSD